MRTETWSLAFLLSEEIIFISLKALVCESLALLRDWVEIPSLKIGVTDSDMQRLVATIDISWDVYRK